MIATGGFDGCVRIWNFATESEIGVLDLHSGSVLDVKWSPDGKSVAAACSDSTVRVATVTEVSSQPQWLWSADYYTAIAVSSDDILGACACIREDEGKNFKGSHHNQNYFIQLLDLKCGHPCRRLVGHDEAILALTFLGNSRLLASGSRDNSVRIWDTSSGEQLVCFREHRHFVSAITSIEDGLICVSGGGDHTIRAWSTKTGKQIAA